MRKMFARAADWAAKLRRCPVVPGEEVEQEETEGEATIYDRFGIDEDTVFP